MTNPSDYAEWVQQNTVGSIAQRLAERRKAVTLLTGKYRKKAQQVEDMGAKLREQAAEIEELRAVGGQLCKCLDAINEVRYETRYERNNPQPCCYDAVAEWKERYD